MQKCKSDGWKKNTYILSYYVPVGPLWFQDPILKMCGMNPGNISSFV